MSSNNATEELYNRFALPVLATERANELENGSPAFFLDGHNHKASVVALQEIEAGVLDLETLREKIITRLQQTLAANKNTSDQIGITIAEVDELENLRRDINEIDDSVYDSDEFSVSDEELSMLDDDDIKS
jgi:DNA-directed RNA polymerase omega subunit